MRLVQKKLAFPCISGSVIPPLIWSVSAAGELNVSVGEHGVLLEDADGSLAHGVVILAVLEGDIVTFTSSSDETTTKSNQNSLTVARFTSNQFCPRARILHAWSTVRKLKSTFESESLQLTARLWRPLSL